MTYKKSDDAAHEANHIAYNTAAIYTIGKIDDTLFTEVADKNFSSLSWVSSQRVIQITGPSNKTAIRFGQVDETGRYLRFYGKPQHPTYSSLPLLRATAHDHLDFLRRNLSMPVIQTKKFFESNKTAVGLAIGDATAYISPLLVAEDDRLYVVDIQPIERGAGHEFTVVSAVDAATEAATRAAFDRICKTRKVLETCRFNTNTRISLTPA